MMAKHAMKQVGPMALKWAETKFDLATEIEIVEGDAKPQSACRKLTLNGANVVSIELWGDPVDKVAPLDPVVWRPRIRRWAGHERIL